MKREARLTNFLFGVAHVWVALILLAPFVGWHVPSWQAVFGVILYGIFGVVNIGAAVLSE